eukprot:g7302.t1
MRAGDIADIQVSYYAADQKRTSALSFMLLYNKLHYRLKSKKMPEIPGCDLAQFHDVKDTSEQMDHSHGIAFSCSSFADVKVLPAKVPRIMEVQLEATGAPGAGQIALVPNKMLHALGYKYKMAAPIELAMGHCSKADMPASFMSRASGRTQVLGVRGNSHRCVEKGDTATFAVDYHTANDERADAVALRLSPTRSPTLSPTQSPTLSPTLSPTPAPKARWIGQHVLGKGTEQVLSLSATTKSCMDVGDRTDLSVSYYAADGAKTTGLSFKLLYDNSYFTLNASATAVGDTSKCHGASGSDSVFNLAMHASAVDYTCTSSHEQNIIPAAASGFLNISLVATGKTGTTNLSIAANPYVKGAGYNYVTAPPKPVLPLFSFDMGTGSRIGRSDTDGEQYVTVNGEWSAADVTSPSFSTAAAAEKAPPSELAPLPEYLASAKSATSEEVTTMLAHGLMEGAASSVMTSFLASFGGGVNNHFGMGEDQDFGMASPTHLSWAPDEAEIGKKPSAMVLGVLDTSGVAYLTKQGDLYKDLMSTQPKWVPTPPRQCMVTQSDVTAQCGVEECAPPT